MSRMPGQSAFGSKTTCIFRPRMRPFDLAQSHSLPSGMGVASISFTIAAPSPRVCRSSWLATRVSAKSATGRRLLASHRVQRTTAQMVMMLTVGVPTRFQAPQADGRGELGVDQRQQMVPAWKRFDVGIAGVTLNERLELAPLDRFQKLAEDARCEAHAPSSF